MPSGSAPEPRAQVDDDDGEGSTLASPGRNSTSLADDAAGQQLPDGGRLVLEFGDGRAGKLRGGEGLLDRPAHHADLPAPEVGQRRRRGLLLGQDGHVAPVVRLDEVHVLRALGGGTDAAELVRAERNGRLVYYQLDLEVVRMLRFDLELALRR